MVSEDLCYCHQSATILFVIDPHSPPSASSEIDSIRTEYPPNSRRPSRVDRFEDYRSHDDTTQPHVFDSRPWWPFRSRTDFELAELALEAALMKKQIDKLIKCVSRCDRIPSTSQVPTIFTLLGRQLRSCTCRYLLEFVRFVHEPWTAQHFWDVQVCCWCFINA